MCTFLSVTHLSETRLWVIRLWCCLLSLSFGMQGQYSCLFAFLAMHVISLPFEEHAQDFSQHHVNLKPNCAFTLAGLFLECSSGPCKPNRSSKRVTPRELRIVPRKGARIWVCIPTSVWFLRSPLLRLFWFWCLQIGLTTKYAIQSTEYRVQSK